MPIDLRVTFREGTEQMIHIQHNETFWTKPEAPSRHVASTWNWVEPNYSLELTHPGKQVARIDIDPSGALADVRPEDNFLVVSEGN